MRVRKSVAGFTLVELLVVISIIGTLMSLLLPAVMQAKERGRQTQCANSLKNIGFAAMQYESSKKHFPGYANPVVDPANGNFRVASYIVPLLGSLDQNVLQQSWQNAASLANANERFRGQGMYMSILVCPSDTRPQNTDSTSYVINSGVEYSSYPTAPQGETNPYLSPGQKSAAGISYSRFDRKILPANPAGIYVSHEVSSDAISAGDGTSNTLLLSENLQALSWWIPATNNLINDIRNTRAQTTFVWYGDADSNGILTPPADAMINTGKDKPASNNIVFARPSSNHPGLVQVAFCDNHVRSINDTIEYYVYAQLMTANSKTPTVKISSNQMDVIREPGSGNPPLPYILSEENY